MNLKERVAGIRRRLTAVAVRLTAKVQPGLSPPGISKRDAGLILARLTEELERIEAEIPKKAMKGVSNLPKTGSLSMSKNLPRPPAWDDFDDDPLNVILDYPDPY